MRSDWIVVVPFRAAAAKSRFGPGDNSALALAMALDTVEAALRVARVIVVTDVAAGFLALGAAVHSDPGAGLNAAIDAGLEVAGIGSARVVLLGDHPALTSTELADVLDLAIAPLTMVSDADGDGSALTAAMAGVPHAPAFGAGSRQKHVAAGYLELDGAWPGLRRDVDTRADLAALAELNVFTDPDSFTVMGPRTAAWLASSASS